MEVEKLVPFVTALLLVGLIVGVGTLVLDKFGQTVTTSRYVWSENVTMTTDSGNTANKFVQTLDGCRDAVNGTKLTVGSTCNYSYLNDPANTLTVVTVASQGAKILTLNYTYKADSAATTSIYAGRTAVGDIAEDWLSLVVTIGVLALILGLTIAGFQYYGNRR